MQIFFIIIASSISYLIDYKLLNGVSVIYGGFISIANYYLITMQKNIITKNINTIVFFMVGSVVIRIIVVALLVLIGFKINLLALEIIIGLVAGQIGFLLDKIR